MKTAEITIRIYTHSDLPEVLNLWEKYSGWGRPEEKEFLEWMKTPFGDCILLIAENEENEIVGQIFFTPTEFFDEGVKATAVKVSSPIVHEAYRSSKLTNRDSVVGSLFIEGIRLMKERDYAWIYNFPAYGWAKILRSVHYLGFDPWDIAIFPCLEIIGDETDLQEYEFMKMEDFTDNVNSVWENFKKENQNLSFMTRNLSWLRYKWIKELKVGIFKNNKLVGYCVIKRNSGLVLDFILNEVKDYVKIFNGLNKFYRTHLSSGSNSLPAGLILMPNGPLKLNLNDLKVKSVDFNFVFGISSLKGDKRITPFASDKWYIFPND